MVEIRIAYEGSLRCRCEHGPSEAQLTTDAPVDNRGKGESFSPTDLVATGLGSCLLTILAMAAEDRGVELGAVRATVAKHMAADPVRRIARLDVRIEVPADVPERARAGLEQAALACPVTQSLAPTTEVTVTFVWGSVAAR